MKIRMKTLQAGPDVIREVGHVYDVPTAEAKALIAGNYAEEVTRQIPVERATRVTTSRRGQLIGKSEKPDEEGGDEAEEETD